MANIGTFTADKDGFAGTLRTLTLNVKVKAGAQRQGRQREGPDFRLQAASHDIGAAWKKTSEAGREYISVTLDDPSFPSTVYARLIEGENRHARPDLVAQQAPGGVTAARSAPPHGGALRCSSSRTQPPQAVPHIGLRFLSGYGVYGCSQDMACQCDAPPGFTGYAPCRLAVTAIRLNPSRLRACGAARFACLRGSPCSPRRAGLGALDTTGTGGAGSTRPAPTAAGPPRAGFQPRSSARPCCIRALAILKMIASVGMCSPRSTLPMCRTLDTGQVRQRLLRDAAFRPQRAPPRRRLAPTLGIVGWWRRPVGCAGWIASAWTEASSRQHN